MESVGNGFVDCVNLLLAEGANIQALDMYHRSALHRAVSSGVQAAVDLVILESTLSRLGNTGNIFCELVAHHCYIATLLRVFKVAATCCAKWRGVQLCAACCSNLQHG